jgi:hypothetical protein
MKSKIKRANPPLIDNVLLCGKKENKRQFHIWAIGAPDLQARAATLELAEELLVDQMWRRYDLDEPFGLKYEGEPAIRSEATDVLLKVAPNEVADATEPARYFRNGFCLVCQTGQGGRNGELLLLESLPKNVECGLLVRFQPFLKCGMRVGMCLLHRRICESLQEICEPLVEFRQVRTVTNKLCEFRELIPKRAIPIEVPLNRKGRIGGVCVQCGARSIFAEIQRGHSGLFITAENADLIRHHGIAAVGDESRPTICMSAKVWKEINKMKWSKGLLASLIGVLQQQAINPRPPLDKIVAFKV